MSRRCTCDDHWDGDPNRRPPCSVHHGLPREMALASTEADAFRRGQEAGRLQVRRELNDALGKFADDDGCEMGDLLDVVVNPFLLTKEEEAAYEVEKALARTTPEV